MRKFSIIIPTKKNATLLDETLSSIAKVKYPTTHYEVIVVDNGTDSSTTHDLFLKRKKTLKNLKYITELKQGASHARNAGVSKAKYEYLIFLDDDVVIKEKYLQYYDYAWEKYKGAKILSGQVNAVLKDNRKLSKKQRELLQKYPWCFAHRTDIKEDYEVDLGDTFFSANMSYFLEGAERNIFSTRLGVHFYTFVQLSGEDSELCTRKKLEQKKIIILASNKVQVDHQVSENRFNSSYIMQRHFICGIELFIMDKILKEKFQGYHSHFLKQMHSISGLFNLFKDKYAREMYFSYSRFGKYFWPKAI